MKLLLLLGFLFATAPASAALLPEDIEVSQRYYGILEIRDENKFRNINDTAPYRQRVMDLRKFAAEVEVEVGEKNEFEFELEVEHGGTGGAMEFDQLEEFGEFEHEIERGGEVELEEAYYKRRLSDSASLIVGKHPLFISLSSVLRHPLEHVNPDPARLEGRMIPVEWAETGLQYHQHLPGRLTLRLGIVSGLNSEFYRKYNWIGGGYQRQFEDMRFDEPAYTGSLEFGDIVEGHGLGFAYYTGKTTDNRRKKDLLTDESKTYLWSAMGNWRVGRVGLMGQVIRGRITNSDQVSLANNKLGQLAKPKTFFPVGAAAQLDTVQLNYEFIDTWSLFAEFGHVDTFADTAGVFLPDQRYDVRQTGWGFTHTWDQICALKYHAFKEWTHKSDLPTTTTHILQFVFDTGLF